MGLLTGTTVVVTGVLTDQSIAFHIARLAQEEGADIILTSFGRTMSLTRRSATRLPTEPPIVELDVTNDDDLAQFSDRLGEHCETVDGLVHSIGFAPESALGGNFLHTAWSDVATAMQVSAYSLASLTMAAKPRMMSGASVVGLDFDASVAWPTYDWMGVWQERAPLGWDLTDPAPAARACVALMSPWFAATTGEIVHVDGGVHSQGA